MANEGGRRRRWWRWRKKRRIATPYEALVSAVQIML